MPLINRIDYPDPSKIRENTVILDKNWQICIGEGGNYRKINMPFCPQSRLSGIGLTDFIPRCRYRTEFKADRCNILEDGRRDDGTPLNYRRVILHFGAVEWRAVVYLNGHYLGSHAGGYTPFEFDITDCLDFDGNNLLCVDVFDEENGQASGKQSKKRNSYGCFYTRVTGIWQPVWLEYTYKDRIKNFKFYTKENAVGVLLSVFGSGNVRAEVSRGGKTMGSYEGFADGSAYFEIPLKEIRRWGVNAGNLYDIRMEFEKDCVYSYFGLRTAGYSGYGFLLNNETVFQRFVMLQGYYKDGVYTAPGTEYMQRDIDLIKELGFNGARLHEKTFDPRFLYLCDLAGLMVWGEYAGWGVDYSDLSGFGQFISEWNEVIDRDFNHPSVITWCPLNEVWLSRGLGRDVRFIDFVYNFTKNADPTRPCVDVSGGFHGNATDLYDFHSYEPADKLGICLEKLDKNDELDVRLLYSSHDNLRYKPKLPVAVSECGGIICGETRNTVPDVNERGVMSELPWGYGNAALSGDDFVEKYRQLVAVIAACPKISGFCYTQLYDIEQECNGFYRYDRSDKLSAAQKKEIKKINLSAAAIEKSRTSP